MKKANNKASNNNVKNAKNAQNAHSGQNGRNCGKQSPENCD